MTGPYTPKSMEAARGVTGDSRFDGLHAEAGLAPPVAQVAVFRRRETGTYGGAPYVEWIRALVPDPADQAWLFANFVPQSLATYSQPIRLGIKDLPSNPAAGAIGRAFIFCTEGKEDAAGDCASCDPSWVAA